MKPSADQVEKEAEGSEEDRECEGDQDPLGDPVLKDLLEDTVQ